MNSDKNTELNYCHNCMKLMASGETICPDCGYDNAVNHNTPDTLPEGAILKGQYLVGKVLGQGGFGITYLGIDTALKTKIAIKEYYPRGVCSRIPDSIRVTGVSTLSHPEDFERGCDEFQSEAETLAGIRSRNIVRVMNYFRENGTAYIVMEYAEGISLAKEAANQGGRLPYERVMALFKSLIPELEKMHDMHLIHRDIKPQNLQLVRDVSGNEELVLLDFGTARRYKSLELSQTYTAMLTPGFAPLEQYSEHTIQGPYTDVYALCATMYYLITGIIPPSAPEQVTGDNPLKTITELGLNVPEKTEKAILHGLETRKEVRTQTMRELYDELYEQEQPTITEPEPPEKPVIEEPPHPGKKWLPLILLVLVVLMIAGAFIFTQNNKKIRESLEQTQTVISFRSTATQTAEKTEAASKSPEDLYALGKEAYFAGEYKKALEYLLPAAEAEHADAQGLLGYMYSYGQGVEQSDEKAVKYYQMAADQGNSGSLGNLAVMYKTGRGVEQSYEKAFELFMKSVEADGNNTGSLTQLGYLYKEGTGVEQSYEKAAEYFRAAADLGFGNAQFQLGSLYFYGHGVEKDYVEALRLFKLAAEEKDPTAQVWVGYCFENGYGVTKDYDEALKWYQLAADQGDSQGQQYLKSLQEKIRKTGEAKDAVPALTPTVTPAETQSPAELFALGKEAYNAGEYEKAAEYLIPAAEAGHSNAQNYLGYIYRYRIANNDEKAVYYWKLAADQGKAESQYHLGMMYESGRGVEQSYEQAAKWYQLAADQGYADAQARLGYKYSIGQGVEQSDEKAVKYFNLAADQGNSNALGNLAVMYKTGRGIEQSYKKAFEFFLKSVEADGKNTGSLTQLGYLYKDGTGVERSYEKAAEYFRAAADLGFAEAQFQLGLLYENGQGVEQSYEQAAKWYQEAADQGYAVAQRKLGILYFKAQGVEKDYAKAVHFFKLAAEEKDPTAQVWVGYCYENGYGVTQDYDEALKWYQLAADQGDSQGQQYLKSLQEKIAAQ